MVSFWPFQNSFSATCSFLPQSPKWLSDISTSQPSFLFHPHGPPRCLADH
jgi:hypothetical protein